jgi:S1-C subfamily serine protease
MWRIGLLLVTFLVFCPPILARVWTDASGLHKTEAEFIRFDGKTVFLKRTDGREVGLSLELLSDADQEFVRQQLPNRDNLRTWTDRTGQSKTSAEFVEASGNQVSLRRADGQLIKVPLDRLSADDQKYVKSRTADSGESRKSGLALFKSATALVDLGYSGSGSAFCVDKRGLFVTNAHVVAAASTRKTVDLVINPSTGDEKVVKAQVVGIDRRNDLAILLADAEGPWSVLELGETDSLRETTAVVALGYPFGRMLAMNRDGYPNVSINKGSIASLRTRGGRLEAIQIDAEINPGNSGGPLLDRTGKVIGVVTAKVLFSRVAFAVPSDRIREMLDRPHISFSPPPIKHCNIHRPCAFEVSLHSFDDSTGELDIELVLGKGEDARTIVAERQGDKYSVEVVPVPESEHPPQLYIKSTTSDGAVTANVDDVDFSIGETSLRLCELRRLEKEGDAYLAVTVYGEKLFGDVEYIPKLTDVANGREYLPDHWNCLEVFSRRKPLKSLPYVLLGRRPGEGNVVATVSGVIEFEGLPQYVDPGAVDPNVIAYWRFEDASNDVEIDVFPRPRLLHDFSGHGNLLLGTSSQSVPQFLDATPASTVPLTGQKNRFSLYFDRPEPGSARHVMTTHQGAGFDLEKTEFKQWTVETSVRIEDLAPSYRQHAQVILSIGGGDNGNAPANNKQPLRLVTRHYQGRHVIAACAQSADGQTPLIVSQFAVEVGHWYHVAVISDGAEMRLYINRGDGYEKQGEAPFTASLRKTGGPWYIGCGETHGAPAGQFHGYIDEIRISATALEMDKLLFSQNGSGTDSP